MPKKKKQNPGVLDRALEKVTKAVDEVTDPSNMEPATCGLPGFQLRLRGAVHGLFIVAPAAWSDAR